MSVMSVIPYPYVRARPYVVVAAEKEKACIDGDRRSLTSLTSATETNSCAM